MEVSQQEHAHGPVNVDTTEPLFTSLLLILFQALVSTMPTPPPLHWAPTTGSHGTKVQCFRLVPTLGARGMSAGSPVHIRWEPSHAGGEQRASKFHLSLQLLLHQLQYCQSSTSCQISFSA